jgi:hypothetical protein
VASTPEVKQLYDELSTKHKRFVMVSLSLDEQDYLPRRHAERYGLTWPQARIGLDSQIRTDYGVKGITTCFVIGPKGKIICNKCDSDMIREAVAAALSNMGGSDL